MAFTRALLRIVPALLAVLALSLASLLPAVATAQSNPEDGRAQVIAQGVDLMPRVPVAWRLTTSEAAPADEAEYFARTLGFTIGADDPILVTDRDSGANTLLQDGQASFHPEGAVERRASTTDGDAHYVNIELIVADAVATGESLGSSTLVLASNDFTAPSGHRNLQLSGNVLAPGEEDGFARDSGAPYLLYVSDGIVEVTNEGGHSFEIAAGNGGAFAGEVEILAGANQGGTYLIASIGDEVELPPVATQAQADEAATGTVEISLEACPDGLDADCEPTTNADVTVPAFHHVDDENWIIPDRAKVSDDGTTYTWKDLPAGTYTTGPEEEAIPGVSIDGAEWDDDEQGWVFTVKPRKTTELTLQVVTGDDRGDTGSLLVTLYDCPAGTDPASDDSACEVATKPWNVLIEHPGQGDTTTWSLQDDALDLGDGQYWFELLPAESLVFWPDDARDANLDAYVIAGGPYELGNIWSVDIPYHGAAEAIVYRVEPGDAAGSGWLTLVQFDCPAGTSPDDLSICETATSPRDIVLEHIDTGESWSSFADAEAESDAQFFFPELPAGDYSISGYDPSGTDEVYFSGDVGFGDGAPIVMIAADADHDLFVYVVPAGDTPDDPTEEPVGGTGSLVIAQLDCPYGTDISVDTSACDTSASPWAVTVTNTETGESWSLLDNGSAWDSGTYVLEALPAGSYAISVASNGNWDVSYPGSVEVTADDETYVDVYSVDLRVP